MTTKIQFFKNTLKKLEKYHKSAERIDSVINKEIDAIDFKSYIYEDIHFKYQDLIIKSLAQMWDKPQYVLDWIEYYLHEAKDMKDGGKAYHNEKEYIIKDVESLCIYLLDFYKIIGEKYV